MRRSSIVSARAALLALAVVAGLAAAWCLKAPCRDPFFWNGKAEYSSYCYNEFTPLYSARGFSRGLKPYLQAPFEYPLLSGAAAWWAARSGGGVVGFYDRLALLLALSLVLSIVAVARLCGGVTWRSFAYALAPPVTLYLFQNFDQLAVAPALLGLWALRKRRIGWAGVAFGVGAAFKLFPAVIAFGAALTLADERSRWRPGARLLAWTTATFIVLNLPIALLNFEGWRATWSFHAGRLADWGSIFYWLSRHSGWSLVAVSRVGDWFDLALFIGLIAALVRLCVKRKVATETAAAIALAAFLLGNKVWSPQYALWLLPFFFILDLNILWAALFSAIEIAEVAGKFEWFASPHGVNEVNGWMYLFEAAIWLRWLFTAALTWKLFFRPAAALSDEKLLPARAPEPASPPLFARAHWRIGALLLATAAIVYGARLNQPHNENDKPLYVHDECYQAFTAHRYVQGDPHAWDPRSTRDDARRFEADDLTASTTYEWVHPPAAKLVMAFWIRLLGFKPVAYRLGSLIFGLLLLTALWRLAARMHGEGFAALALLLLATDGMTFVLSRVAMNDIYAVACAVSAVYLLYRYWTETERRQKLLIGAGALFGLGLAMKWSVLPLFGECALLVAARTIWDARAAANRERALAAASWLAAFVLLPIAIYLAAHLPFFLQGHSFADFIELFKQIRWYHSHLTADHAYGSRWWTWPLVARPVWFYSSHPAPGQNAVVYAFGNPILWWSFLPSLTYVAYRFWRSRLAKDALILIGFFGSWLPWLFVRRVGFIQYLLPAVPFGVLAVATALRDLASRRWGRVALAVGAGACVVSFVFFYPIWSAWAIDSTALASHHWLWFDSWR